MKTALFAALMLTVAVPAAAQEGPGFAGGQPQASSLSPQGRAILKQARQASDPRASHAAIQATRDRILTILEADRLDTGALARAMDDERAAVAAQQQRHGYAMLQAFGQLSPADRRAFVADARAARERMEARVAQMRALHGAGGPAGQ